MSDQPVQDNVTPIEKKRKKPVEVSINLTDRSMMRLMVMQAQAEGAARVAQVAEQGARAAAETAANLAAAFQNQAYSVMEAKQDAKLPNGDVEIKLDPDDRKLTFTYKPTPEEK